MQGDDKYVVIEWEDIQSGLSSQEQFTLERLIHLIAMHRLFQGKPENKYMVLNQNEPYFPEVLKLVEYAEKRKEEKT